MVQSQKEQSRGSSSGVSCLTKIPSTESATPIPIRFRFQVSSAYSRGMIDKTEYVVL